eukprot:6211807-Pleurochrysis_carterae.AAC.4
MAAANRVVVRRQRLRGRRGKTRNDDAVRRGHPDVVGAGRPHTASEVNADPSSRVHSGFGVGRAWFDGECAATER